MSRVDAWFWQPAEPGGCNEGAANQASTTARIRPEPDGSTDSREADTQENRQPRRKFEARFLQAAPTIRKLSRSVTDSRNGRRIVWWVWWRLVGCFQPLSISVMSCLFTVTDSFCDI